MPRSTGTYQPSRKAGRLSLASMQGNMARPPALEQGCPAPQDANFEEEEPQVEVQLAVQHWKDVQGLDGKPQRPQGIISEDAAHFKPRSAAPFAFR